jgi:ribosomal protein S18 acetylase RimI-like enzyme
MLALPTLPEFPSPGSRVTVSAPMQARSLGVRAAQTSDVPYLRTLYHALRDDELSQTGWPESFKQSFLDSQFAMQHRQYVDAYADADFWLIEHQQQAIGRYYLLRQPACYHIIDITLEPSWRGRGIGGLLLQWSQSMAQQAGAAGIDLHVDERNPGAQRLYARWGFTETKRESPYIGMRWSSDLQLKTA